MIAYIKKVKWPIFLQLLFDMLGGICLATAPLVLKWLFDEGIFLGMTEIVLAIVVYVVLLVAYALNSGLFVYAAFLTGVYFEKELKKSYFRAVFSKRKEDFQKIPVGEYISIQGNDITALEQDYLQPIISTVCQLNRMLVYLIVLYTAVDFRLATVIFLTSITSILIPKAFGKMLAKNRKNYQDEQASYVILIKDLLEGFSVINKRTYPRIIEVHDKEMDLVAAKRIRYGRAKSVVLGISDLSTKLIKIATFITMAILLVKGKITVGICVAALSYIEAFIEPIDSILYNITTAQSMNEVKKKVLAMLEIAPADELRALPEFRSSIVCRDLCYEKDDFSLKNVNITFEKGKKYAIIGPSGSGKSTLIKLIMGYISPRSGEITIDGAPVEEVDLSGVVAYIDQQEHIYRVGTKDNITVFGAYGSSPNIPVGALKSSCMIRGLLDRDEEKNAQNFSGGEKQMIAFLRALSKESDILIMDEPFSAVDQAEREAIESEIMQGRVFRDKTVLMITHDVSKRTLARFDEVIRIENGMKQDEAFEQPQGAIS